MGDTDLIDVIDGNTEIDTDCDADKEYMAEFEIEGDHV